MESSTRVIVQGPRVRCMAGMESLARTKSMKNSLFVRPNLTVFVVGAFALVALQHLVSDGKSSDHWLLKVTSASARELGDSDMRELMRAAAENPSAETYRRLSLLCERRGDFRRALQFLRESERLGDGDVIE